VLTPSRAGSPAEQLDVYSLMRDENALTSRDAGPKLLSASLACSCPAAIAIEEFDRSEYGFGLVGRTSQNANPGLVVEGAPISI
jgi:hypothetical protein